MTRTPGFFTKQRPEMVKQDFLCRVLRVRAALPELKHQQGPSVAVNPGRGNTDPKFGGARKSPRTSELARHTVIPQTAFRWSPW